MRPGCITFTREAKIVAHNQSPHLFRRFPICGCTGKTDPFGVYRTMLFIRREQPEDIAAIHELHKVAFGRPAEADLVDALRARSKATLSLVAVEDDRIVGHILFSPVTIDSAARTFSAVGLAPMAVLPERQRRGIGSQLVSAGLLECRNAGYDCVVVLGHPTYYPRFGFVPASRYGLRSEYEVPDEAFMALAWHAGVLEDRGGVVRYQPEFDEI
jgi:putative acetyltransferase